MVVFLGSGVETLLNLGASVLLTLSQARLMSLTCPVTWLLPLLRLHPPCYICREISVVME